MGTCGITVSGGNTALPYVGPNPSNPMTGMVRINNTELEVFNGSNWQQISTSYATVTMDQDILDIIQWGRKKRDEERAWESLANDNKAVKIALDNLEQAKRQLDVTVKLSREYETTS